MVKVMEIGYNVVDMEDGDSVEIVDGALYVSKGYKVVGVFAAGQWISASVVEKTEDGITIGSLKAGDE